MTEDARRRLVPVADAASPEAVELLARIRQRRPRSEFQRRHERRRAYRACQAACKLSDAPDRDREPVRLDLDQRPAQLRHARAHGFYRWEIETLVPAPHTDHERAVLAP